MKKLIVIFLLLKVADPSVGQILKGKVIDSETKEPIAYAVAYFDGTAIASYTDLKGSFILDIKKATEIPLTISALGYYSTTLSDYSSRKDIIAYLTPKIFTLEDISVKAKGNPNLRKQNMYIFKTEFLGRTKNTKQCEILNENDIRFITSDDKDTLKAYSIKPIFVLNRALGYKITYYLNKFEYVKSKYQNQLIGNSLFDDDTSSLKKILIDQKRNETFYGSKMHLIRSLWADSLKEAGYTIKFDKKRLSVKDLVRNQLSITPDPDQPRKSIYYLAILPTILSIKWEPGKDESGLELTRNNILISRNGYYKGPGIIWHGEMAKQGIADLLPYDFQPTEKMNLKIGTDYKILDRLTQKVTDFEYADLMEKVYLHTDRDFYNPGDLIWFKCYLVDGFTHLLSDSSKVLHVDLINENSKILISKVIKLENGLGNGEISLSDTLSSGAYMLRAYTNYMRNFGEELFFKKEIRVFNSSDSLNSDTNLTEISDDIEVNFFPEGGSLIENVRSIVAFKAIDTFGRGCDVSGEIYSSGGELLTSFKSTHRGMGRFFLRPLPGLAYYALVKNSQGRVIKYDLPKVLPRGFNLSARNIEDESIVTLKTNSETLPRYTGRDLMLMISKHEKPIKLLVVKIDSLTNTLIIPSNDLPEGVLMVTLFGLDNKPLCERLIYIHNNESVDIGIETNKTVFKQRDSVEVKLSVTKDFGFEDEAFLSFSATENIYKDPRASSISSWFLLESDIKGPIEDPTYYFNPSNPERLTNLDLLLLTQGWRDFVWKYKEITNLPETGFVISGRVRKPLLDIPLANYTVSIGLFQGDKNIITSVTTDSLGKFKLEIENLSGNAKLVVSSSDQKGNQKGKIVLDSLKYYPPKISPLFSGSKKPDVNNQKIKKEYRLLLEADETNKLIRKQYTLSDTILIGEVQVFGTRKQTPKDVHINQSRVAYGEPDRELVITPELSSIRSIKDLLVGRVAGVYPAPNGHGLLRVGTPNSSMLLNSEPLYVLDGIVVSLAEISRIPIDWIDRVDVIMYGRAAAYGIRGSNGVISIITKTVKEVTFKPETYSITANISGFDSPRIFYSPKHKAGYQPEQIQDNRSTLYWFPDIKVNINQDYSLKFYNADKSATYNIIVEGITSDGIPLTGQIQYDVK